MIKNIEQYLLKNFPILWNLKIVPMGIIALLIHLFFFGAGYLVANPTMKDDSFRNTEVFILIYAGSILFIVLLFIFWLIQYNKHNALRAFYPQSNLSLYLEWLLIFAFCIVMFLTPNTLSLGKELKWKNVVSKTDAEKAWETIQRVYTLLPSAEYNFSLQSDQTPLFVGEADVDRTKFNPNLYTYEEGIGNPSNPIEYIGPSLLYYKGYYYTSDESIAKVQQWLIAEKEDSIRATIQAFLDLHEKHKLKTNIDVDTWMQMIYNPPLYPVEAENLIGESQYTASYQGKYTSMSSLDGFYREMIDVYTNKPEKRWNYLIPTLIAMGISVMIFSARVTSGRSWIFALLSLGVVIFIFSLISGLFLLIEAFEVINMIPLVFWLGLFIVLGILLIKKIVMEDAKGYSKIYINLFIWFVPALIPWLFQAYLFSPNRINEGEVENLEYLTHSVMIADVIFTTVVMFFIAMLARKWRALPEQ